jgi:hypothetical protein
VIPFGQPPHHICLSDPLTATPSHLERHQNTPDRALYFLNPARGNTANILPSRIKDAVGAPSSTLDSSHSAPPALVTRLPASHSQHRALPPRPPSPSPSSVQTPLTAHPSPSTVQASPLPASRPSNGGGSSAKKNEPRQRSSIACSQCRKSKIKCVNNGSLTQCNECKKKGRECLYSDGPPKRSSSHDPDRPGEVSLSFSIFHVCHPLSVVRMACQDHCLGVSVSM